jgi:hypothetical protein
MTAWRVYRPEWLTVYVSDRLEVEGQDQCQVRFRDYAGRVRSEDWRLCPVGSVRPARYKLMVRLPNLKGEFKEESKARKLLATLGGQAVLVTQGSAEERELLAYGRRRLPDQVSGVGTDSGAG